MLCYVAGCFLLFVCIYFINHKSGLSDFCLLNPFDIPKERVKKTHLPNFTKWQAVTQANVAAGTSGSMREVSQALRHGWGVSACI